MFVKKKMDRLYESIEKDRIVFDDRSQYVFMSDLHRGDNSAGDEFGQNRHIYYHALQYYFHDGFTYVEAGDGDELWETVHYEYIRSSHAEIFQLLKKFNDDNRLIMIYGNHNIQISDPEYVKKNMTNNFDEFLDREVEILPGLKPVEAVVMEYEKTGQEIFVCHGHQGQLLNDQLWFISFVFCRFFWRYLHRLGFNYAANPAKNRYKRAKMEKAMSKWLETKGNLMLICGHTHRSRLPQPGQPRYFNIGCGIHPRGITCIEIVFGEIALVSWSMHARRDGMLYIKRTVIKGPIELEKFI